MVIPRGDDYLEANLRRIAEKARAEPKSQFTSLFHLMNVDLLRGCFMRLDGTAAAGIDGITKAQYGEQLEVNLNKLVTKLHQNAFFPKAVLRVFIPKAGTKKMRPLGIPTLEDKLVQAGLVKILEQIYEADFVDESYGFRSDRGCHDALRALSRAVEGNSVNHIVEADIKGFFDNVDHDQLLAFLAHRIGDKRVLRYIGRILKAGVRDNGVFQASERGTPQGGVISPLLANIYLHYSLDLWFTKKFSGACSGFAQIVRYADDFVVCFRDEADAKRFRIEMEERLLKFGLEIAPEKTKCVEFGKFAVKAAKRRGEKAATFDFLGFTHYCSKSQNGRKFRMKRKTVAKRFTAKLKAITEWLHENRTTDIALVMQTVAKKLTGHYNYYGVTDNSGGINRFHFGVREIIRKWLSRRGRARNVSWEKFLLLMQKYALPPPRVTVNLF